MTRVRRLSWKNVEIRTKLLCSIIGIIVLIMAGILMSVNFVVTKGLHNNKRESIGKTIGFLEWHIEGESQELEKYVQFLVNDAALKEAINACLFTEEFGEVAALCKAKKKDLGVDRITIYEPVGETKSRLIASSGEDEAAGKESALTNLQKEALQKGVISSPICDEGACKIEGYGVIKKREEVVAYLSVTKVLGTNFAKKIEVSTGAKVVIIKHDRADTGKVIMAESADMIGKDISNKLIGEVASTQETSYMSGYEYEGKSHMAVFKPMVDRANEPIGILMSLIDMEDVIKVKRNITFALLASAVIALAIGVVLALFIIRGITKPFQEIFKGLKTFSALELQETGEKFNRAIAGLTEGSEQVASASVQVSSSSQSLAEGAAEQASSLEETSSSLEEMSSMTKQNADNANQADILMKDANQVVGKANESMTELITSMEEISKASEETSKIIKTIDEIAFQTNLLALNAAVEAARAGEAGAGFAVVADEVRNLAMRAADAAKDTAGLIESTVKKVKDGGELVTRTNEAFGEVAKSASKVGELVGEIAAASNEQSGGIEQVNRTMAEMDKVTQQTAASAEESASASEEMNAQAEQMKGLVGELIAMVGGSGSRVYGGRYRETKEWKPIGMKLDTGVQKATGTPAKKVKAKEVEEVSVPEEVAVPKGKPEVGHGGQVNPDEVIPMEEAEFKDF